MSRPAVTLLKDLLAITKDGEWGKEQSADGLVEMRVIRGTDFERVRYGNLANVPIRYVPSRIANQKTLCSSDILIETAGGTKGRPTGRTLLVKKRLIETSKLPLTCASFSRFMRANPTKVLPEYLFWYLQYLYASGLMDLHQVQHTGLSRFQYTDFASKTEISLPPFSVQRLIAEVLGALDDKIECNRRINQTLEAMVQAFYRHWFVDFSAFQGGEFEESELGLIPQGWKTGNLEEIANIIMGASPAGDTYNESGEGVPLINGPVEFGDYFPTKKKWTTAPTRLTQEGDLVFCVRGSTTGRRVIADDVYCLGRGVCAIRARDGHQIFINKTIDEAISRLLMKASGSVFPNLSGSDIRSLKVLIPPPSIVELFSITTEAFMQQIWLHTKEVDTLATTRDYLLPKLLSGEIEVKATEESVETVI